MELFINNNIFFRIANHSAIYTQVENCGTNLRFVVDEDDSGLKGLNGQLICCWRWRSKLELLINSYFNAGPSPVTIAQH